MAALRDVARLPAERQASGGPLWSCRVFRRVFVRFLGCCRVLVGLCMVFMVLQGVWYVQVGFCKVFGVQGIVGSRV